MTSVPHVQAMADQGSGGAFEISQRMTAMLGWGATTDFREDWTWDQAAETYALDADMAAKLQRANPEVRPQSGLHSRGHGDTPEWKSSELVAESKLGLYAASISSVSVPCHDMVMERQLSLSLLTRTTKMTSTGHRFNISPF